MLFAFVISVVLVSGGEVNVQQQTPTSTQLQHPGDIMAVRTGWLPDNQTQCVYKIVSRPMLGWNAARESCARFADGADLASITSESELQLLSNFATTFNLEVSEAIRTCVC